MDVFLTGFPKKLLVAVSLVIVIAMILPPTECRAMERRHTRHRHLESMAQTKDILRPSLRHDRRRQKRLENLTLATKDIININKRPKNAEKYARETRKIFRKVKNTRSFFKPLKILQKYREMVPGWLPSVNFVEIHFHDYNSGRARRNGSSVPERKFKYLMPRLYKSLVEYEELFKRLQKMELNFPDTPQNSYKSERKHLLHETLTRLYSTIQEVNDSMTAVNMTVPALKNKDLSALDLKVDATQCFRIDYLSFRGYGNLLNNWYRELHCPRNKVKNIHNPQHSCKKWEEKLKEKLNTRHKHKLIRRTT